jgi:hypothetical protein
VRSRAPATRRRDGQLSILPATTPPPRDAPPVRALQPARGTRLVDEYEEVSRVPLALALSLLCFGACLGARYVARLLPESLQPFPRLVMPAVVATVAALLGTLLGLAARRSGTLAGRLAFAANAIALALSLLAVAALLWIFPDLLAPR